MNVENMIHVKIFHGKQADKKSVDRLTRSIIESETYHLEEVISSRADTKNIYLLNV